jgi:hypothetical protein
MTKSAAVEAFLAKLDHPHLAAILALREVILAAGKGVREEIKWNAPSFATTEHFATIHLRTKQGVGVILHRGAKKRKDPLREGSIADPKGLLAWLGDDRAMVTFADAKAVAAQRAAFTRLLKAWLAHV